MVQAGPSTVRRAHGHPRRRKNNSALLISLFLLIGAAVVGGVFAYVVFGPSREASSQLAANSPTVNAEPHDEPSTDEAPATDSVDATETADPTSKQRKGKSDNANETDANDAKPSESPDASAPKESAGQNLEDDAAKPAADATAAADSEPAADPSAEKDPTPTDPPVANKPEAEPGSEPGPESEPETVADPEPAATAAEITFEEANKVLQDIMSHWNARTPFATAVTAADHIASFDVPEWEKRDYHLDKYEIEHEDQFVSKTEQRFRVSMYFIDQDAEPVISRLYSVTVNAEGRWVIARIKKPKPDLKDAPRANIF
jgi:hypothetical protein